MHNQLIIILLIAFILLKLSLSQYNSFSMELDSFQERCLSEYYKSQTVIIYELESRSSEMLLEVKSPDGRIVYHHINNTSLFSLTTKSNGFYSVCTKNMGRFSGEVQLTIKSGISANDFSSVVKSKDLDPIDNELDKIIRKHQILNHFNKISLEKQMEFSSVYNSISSKIIFYSLLMIAGMIMIGVIETLYLKRFMEKRKII